MGQRSGRDVMIGHTLTPHTTEDGIFQLCQCGYTLLRGPEPENAQARHSLHLARVRAEQTKPWRCDDCGAPESLLERGLFHMAGFHDFDGRRGFVQPDAWYCEECYWRARDEHATWDEQRIENASFQIGA